MKKVMIVLSLFCATNLISQDHEDQQKNKK
jgi:hypothetical protein